MTMSCIDVSRSLYCRSPEQSQESVQQSHWWKNEGMYDITGLETFCLVLWKQRSTKWLNWFCGTSMDPPCSLECKRDGLFNWYDSDPLFSSCCFWYVFVLMIPFLFLEKRTSWWRRNSPRRSTEPGSPHCRHAISKRGCNLHIFTQLTNLHLHIYFLFP